MPSELNNVLGSTGDLDSDVLFHCGWTTCIDSPQICQDAAWHRASKTGASLIEGASWVTADTEMASTRAQCLGMLLSAQAWAPPVRRRHPTYRVVLGAML